MVRIRPSSSIVDLDSLMMATAEPVTSYRTSLPNPRGIGLAVNMRNMIARWGGARLGSGEPPRAQVRRQECRRTRFIGGMTAAGGAPAPPGTTLQAVGGDGRGEGAEPCQAVDQLLQFGLTLRVGGAHRTNGVGLAVEALGERVHPGGERRDHRFDGGDVFLVDTQFLGQAIDALRQGADIGGLAGFGGAQSLGEFL